LPFETVLGVWNFSVMLQNVCFDKLNVLCLCKIVYTCHMFLYLYLPLLFFKNKQITTKYINIKHWSTKHINTKVSLTLCARKKQPSCKFLSLLYPSLFLYTRIPTFRSSLPQPYLNYHPVHQLIVLSALCNKITNTILHHQNKNIMGKRKQI
jgi:hypothetical protein